MHQLIEGGALFVLFKILSIVILILLLIVIIREGV